tara:strand:- start:362 stop:562 length:201 start_codon:yes stop_codon:yes gene_type:complete
MTVNDLIDVLIPLLGVALLIIGIVFGVQLVAIALRVRKLLERIETISDVAGWLSLIRKWPKRKNHS